MNKLSYNFTQRLLNSHQPLSLFCKKTGLPLTSNGIPLVYQSLDPSQIKPLVSKSIQKIIQEIEIPYRDPKSDKLYHSGLFSNVDQLILSQDPNSKVYICGETVQGLLSYLYWYLVNEHQNNPGCVKTKQILEEFLDKKSSLSFQEVLGIGGNLNLLLDSSNTIKNLSQVIFEIKKFINYHRDSIDNDSAKSMASVCADVKEYLDYLNHVQAQGGNPLDKLSFPLTERSGTDFCIPKDDPSLLDEYFKGRFTYSRSNDFSLTSTSVARTIDLLLTHPHLTCEEKSSETFCEDLKQIDSSTFNFSIIASAIRSSRVYNLTIHPCNLIKSRQNPIYQAISELSDKHKGDIGGEAKLPLIPEFLQRMDIESRSEDFDPGELRAQNFLSSSEDFFKRHTKRGYIFHGTTNPLNVLSILRNGFIFSSKNQGAAAFGSGVYTSKIASVSLNYTRDNDPLKLMFLKIKNSPKIRILDFQSLKVPQEIYTQWIKMAKQQKMDLFEYLAKTYSIDIIIPDNNRPNVLIQNPDVIDFPNTPEEMQLSLLENFISNLHPNSEVTDEQISKQISFLSEHVSSKNKPLLETSLKKLEQFASSNDISERPYLWIHTDQCKRDKNSLLKILRKTPSIVNHLDKSLREDKEVFICLLEKHFWTLAKANDSLKNDKDVVLAACTMNPNNLKYANDTLTNNEEFMLEVVSQSPYSLEFASESIKNNKRVVLAAAIINQDTLRYASKSLKNDKELFLTLIQKDPYILMHASIALRNDREVILAAIKQNPRTFQYASKQLKKDKEIALAAINSTFWHEDVDVTLRGDKEFMLSAVKIRPSIIACVNDSLKNDKEFILSAVAKDGWALCCASDTLQNDRDIVLAAISQEPEALRYASDALKNDRDIVLAAISQKPGALYFASDALKNDRDIVLAAISQEPGALLYASDALKNDKAFILQYHLSKWMSSAMSKLNFSK